MKAGMTMSFSQSASSAAPRVLTVFSAHACGEYLPWSCCCLWRILTLDLLLLLENTYLGPAVACDDRQLSPMEGRIYRSEQDEHLSRLYLPRKLYQQPR